MDVKLFSTTKRINLSGTSLLIILASILIVGAAAFDWTQGRLSTQYSLTLPLLTCAIASSISGSIVIPILNRLKTGQIVREDGPQAHLKKAGTPTMGGIFLVPVAVIVAGIWSGFSTEAIAIGLVTLGYGFVGWIDDWQVLNKKSNKGISPKTKLLLQVIIGVLFALWLLWSKSSTVTIIPLPFGINLSLGWLFLPLAVFVLTAESNATNLTDGVDGLAAGTGAIALWGLGFIFAASYPDLMVFCACLSGAYLGFLVHNRHPATVFMGDTGSLALGGALAAVGLMSGKLWLLFVISGIFFVESLSVIAQVLYYKATKDENGQGKRLFKMAPIHHHFELSGWQETQVVGLFYLLALFLAVIAYFL